MEGISDAILCEATIEAVGTGFVVEEVKTHAEQAHVLDEVTSLVEVPQPARIGRESGRIHEHSRNVN